MEAKPRLVGAYPEGGAKVLLFFEICKRILNVNVANEANVAFVMVGKMQHLLYLLYLLHCHLVLICTSVRSR